MQKPQGVSFTPWSYCERCGFTFPIGRLVIQKGLRVCTVHCFDKTDIEYRPYIIEEILSDPGTEGLPITPELNDAPEEILF